MISALQEVVEISPHIDIWPVEMSCAEGEQCLPSRVMYGLCVGQNKKPEACHMYLSV